MNETFAVVAFIVLLALLVSRMERERRERNVHRGSHGARESHAEAVIPATPELPAHSPGSKR